MAPESESPAEVAVAAPAHRSQALWLVLADTPAEQRAEQVAAALKAAAGGGQALDGLFEARREGRVVGAAWGQVVPGRTGVLLPAQLVAGEAESTARALHAAVDRFFAGRNVCLAQASLPLVQNQAEARLLAGGYRHLADVHYLASQLDKLRGTQKRDMPQPSRDTPQRADDTAPRTQETAQPAALEFEPYREEDHARLAAILERTYEQTLDCPALNGVRAIDDVLAGHRHTGSFDSARWLIVRASGRDAGCLLLADHPEQNQWELVYMGVLPEARGRRLGLAITRHAQALAARSGRERLVLAVDASNAPALATYAAAGFEIWDTRRVFLKIFRGASTG